MAEIKNYTMNFGSGRPAKRGLTGWHRLASTEVRQSAGLQSFVAGAE